MFASEVFADARPGPLTGTFPANSHCSRAWQKHGWQQLGLQATKSTVGKPAGEEALMGASLSLLHFAQEHPNLFHPMAGERFNMEGKFPRLEATTHKALQVFAVGFAGTGMAPDIVVERTAIFVAALQGVVTQILHRRLRVAPVQTNAFLADICKMPIKGIG